MKMTTIRSNPEKQRGRRPPVRTLCFLLFVLLSTNYVAGQTVEPIIQEYEAVGKGSFDVVNQGDTPLAVTLSMESFTVKENGEMGFGPLDPGIQVKLSAMSMRLEAHATSRIFYTATAEHLPAWFVIYSSFGAPPRKDTTGLNLQFQLPHVVYLLPKHASIKKDDLTIVARHDPTKQVIHCTIENHGANFGRLLQLQVVGNSKRQDGSTGGLFPQSRRMFDVDWKFGELPQKIVVQLKNLKLEQPIVVQE
jgi:P pilus assembly chaperone PapD